MTRLYKILIVGSGNLGSRYLEGILKSNLNLSIIIFEKNYKSILKTKKLIAYLEHNHFISFYKSPDQYKGNPNIDLLINATTSKGRFNLIREYSKKFKIRYFLLEKVLANNLKDLNSFNKLFNKNCWVNTFLRTLKIFTEIKEQYDEKINAKVFGGNWGLLCNSIHYIDLMSWIQKTNVKKISTEKLNTKCFESKREGYIEIYGVIKVLFENESVLELLSNDSKENLTIKMESKKLNFSYNLITGDILNNEISKNIKIPYQSEMSANIIKEIIVNGNSRLTPVDESINQHKFLISQLISHWNETNNSFDKSIPIT